MDVSPAGLSNNVQYTLELQVWRPSPTVRTTGCYSMVGRNLLNTSESVSLIDGVVKATPLPQEQIQFQPEDVLGFYIESGLGGNIGVVALEDLKRFGDEGYETEKVWYAVCNPGVMNSNDDCPCPVGFRIFGGRRVLTNFMDAAPVISVSYSKSGSAYKY